MPAAAAQIDNALGATDDWATATAFAGTSLFTHSYYYHRACVRAAIEVGERHLPEYLVLRPGVDALVVAGLERTTRRFAGVPLKTLRSPQKVYVPYWDLCAVLDPDEDGIGVELPALLRGPTLGAWDVLQLNNVLEGSVILSALDAQTAISWRRWPAPQCDYLPCQDTDTFLASVSKNFRASLRKARNKLHSLADVEFKSHTNAAAVDQALGNFFGLESQGWKGTVEGAIAQNARISRFYQILFEEYAQDRLGWVEINELWAEGKLLASQLCLGRCDTLFVLKIAYDEGYQKASPGNMLLEWLVTRANGNRPIRHLNLISDSAWHQDWSAAHLDNWYIELYNQTPGGLMMRAARAAQQQLKQHPLGGKLAVAGR